MKLHNLILIISALNVSCREPVDDTFSGIEPTPVVNSILVSGSPAVVHVSLAEALSDEPLRVIENARVDLYCNSQHLENLGYVLEGKYQSVSILEAGNTYSCRIAVPGFSEILCSTYLPRPDSITDLSHINIAGVDEEGYTYPALKINFTNNPGEERYFEVLIRLIRHDYESLADLEILTDPVLINEGIPIALFSNELISDSSYIMTINYTTGSRGMSGTNFYPIVVELRSLSHDFYQFRKQAYFYESGRYPDEIGMAMSAVSLYSNIENALGIFAGYSAVVADTLFPINTEP